METTTTTTTEAPAAPHPVLVSRVENRLAKLARYAGADARLTPSRLRKPFTQRNWLALPADVRLEHLRVTLTKLVEEEHAARLAAKAEALAAKVAPAPAVEHAPAPAPANPSRYVVACVAGCGTFHPASSGRPVVVTCGERGQTEAKGKPSVYGTEDTEELLARFRRQAKSGTTSSAAPTGKRANSKAPKKRRRAICSNSH